MMQCNTMTLRGNGVYPPLFLMSARMAAWQAITEACCASDNDWTTDHEEPFFDVPSQWEAMLERL